MKCRPFLTAVTYFLIVIVISHLLPPPTYDWTLNTISDLGSQGHAYKWIMQAGFIGFGLILIAGMVHHFCLNTKSYFLFFVGAYGLSILLTGVFCAASITPLIPSNVWEANLHSIFATVAGISLSLGILWQVIVSSSARDRWTRLLFLLFITGVSGLFGLSENHILMLDKGVIQRILYLIGLIWLIYEERKIELYGDINDRQ